MKLSAKTLLIISLVLLGFAAFTIGFGIVYTWGNDKPFGIYGALTIVFTSITFVTLLFMKKKKEKGE
jgi:hypothetical protein